uniref:Uncharacterized protein n=1 Tax=Candidatus Kentrum sp. MB TaxID=2138164 RepID=A0A450XSJ7_9GAMM|nr:MAG: hypothetical protein BECKMB1821G_GA0114241_11064 [Candidatus Kentron sp. MB]VFK35230.1 MAG: hypothetical protein BECKMB1821I_GA0114274_11064 [Candidatus Kentron sp. MB]
MDGPAFFSRFKPKGGKGMTILIREGKEETGKLVVHGHGGWRCKPIPGRFGFRNGTRLRRGDCRGQLAGFVGPDLKRQELSVTDFGWNRIRTGWEMMVRRRVGASRLWVESFCLSVPLEGCVPVSREPCLLTCRAFFCWRTFPPVDATLIPPHRILFY